MFCGISCPAVLVLTLDLARSRLLGSECTARIVERKASMEETYMHDYWDGLSSSEEESFDSGSGEDESNGEKGTAIELGENTIQVPAFRT